MLSYSVCPHNVVSSPFVDIVVAFPPAKDVISLADTSFHQGNTFTETNSLGVVTAQPVPITTQPTVVTTQPVAATSQPIAATSQEVAATVPAGPPANSTLVVVPSVVGTGSSAGSTGSSGSSGNNSTFTTGTPVASSTSGSGSSGSGSGSGTSSGSGSSSTGKSSSGAGMLQPFLGLGLAGALFAAFL